MNIATQILTGTVLGFIIIFIYRRLSVIEMFTSTPLSSDELRAKMDEMMKSRGLGRLVSQDFSEAGASRIANEEAAKAVAKAAEEAKLAEEAAKEAAAIVAKKNVKVAIGSTRKQISRMARGIKAKRKSKRRARKKVKKAKRKSERLKDIKAMKNNELTMIIERLSEAIKSSDPKGPSKQPTMTKTQQEEMRIVGCARNKAMKLKNKLEELKKSHVFESLIRTRFIPLKVEFESMAHEQVIKMNKENDEIRKKNRQNKEIQERVIRSKDMVNRVNSIVSILVSLNGKEIDCILQNNCNVNDRKYMLSTFLGYHKSLSVYSDVIKRIISWALRYGTRHMQKNCQFDRSHLIPKMYNTMYESLPYRNIDRSDVY